MKKLIYIIVITLTGLVLLTSCVSTSVNEPTSQGEDGIPAFVREARRNAPENVLVGYGSAKLATQSQSKILAETRARAEISRVMDNMVREMIRDYNASSEVDLDSSLAFQESMTIALSKSGLQGAAIFDEDWIKGTYHVVIYMNKADVIREINQAQAAARLEVPAMASFNAEERMNAAFDREYARELQVADRD